MRDSITKLASIAFIGGIVGRGLRYGFNVVIARGLGLEALGIFAFGMVIMKGGGVFARIGLDNASQKFIPVYQSKGDPARVSGTIVLSLLAPLFVGTAVATFLYLGFVTIESLTETSFHSTLNFFLIGIPLFAVMMVATNATYGLKITKYSVYSRDLGQSGIALLLMAIAAFVFSNLNLLIGGYLLSLAAGIVLAILFLIREGALRFNIRPIIEYKKIFAFSLPLTFVSTIQYLVSWTDILILGFFVSPEPIGWYQAAYQTSVLLVVILHSANSIFPTIAADLHEAGNIKELKRVYMAVTRWVTYLTLFGLSIVLVYSNEILSIFGPPVYSAWVALIILAIGQTISAIVGPTGYLLIMTGYERLQLVNTGIVALLNVGLNIVLIQKYGIIGAAAATGLSLTILNILRLIEVWILLEMQPYSLRYWKGLVAIGGGLSVLLLSRILPDMGLFRLMIAGSTAFVVFTLILWNLGFDSVDEALLEKV